MSIDRGKNQGEHHRDGETTSDENAQIKHDEGFRNSHEPHFDQYANPPITARIQKIANCKELFLQQRSEAFTHMPASRIEPSDFSRGRLSG